MTTRPRALLRLASLAVTAALLGSLGSQAVELALEREPEAPRLTRPQAEERPALPTARLESLFGLEPRATPPPPRRPFEGLLLGTLVSSRPWLSVATLELPGGKSISVWEGAAVLDAHIVSIERGRMTIERGGVTEVLGLRSTPPVRSGAASRLSADTWAVSRKAIFERLNDLHGLHRQIHVLPAFRDGRAAGFTIARLAPDSELAQLGVEAGDVIRSVGGEELTNPDSALRLYSALANGAEVSLVLERGGQLLTRHYRFD